MPRDLLEGMIPRPGRDLLAERAPSQGRDLLAGMAPPPRPSGPQMSAWDRAFSSGVDQSPFISGVTGFNTAFDKIIQGILQPVLGNGLLGQRVKRGFENDVRHTDSEYAQARSINPGSALVGNIGGEIAAAVPALVGGGIASRAIAPKLAQSSPMASRILGYGLAEGGLSGAKYVEDEESRLANALKGFGLGAGLGGAGELAAGIPRITNKGVGNKIVGDLKSLKKDFQKEYDAFFNAAERAGVDKIKNTTPKKQLNKVLSQVDKKYYGQLEDFIHSPTPKNAHGAQSDLGKFIRKISAKRDISPAEDKALKIAREAQENIRADLHSALMKKGSSDLSKAYTDISGRYKNELVPYLDNSAIRRAALNPTQKGAIRPDRLPGKLVQEASDPFMAAKGKDYPELMINRQLLPLAKKGTVGLGAYGLYELLKGAD